MEVLEVPTGATPLRTPQQSSRSAPTLQITYLSPDQLLAYPRNARAHPKRQIQKLAASISTFGFLVPVLVSESGEVIAGHARVAAAKTLGCDLIPCICAEHLTAKQTRAYRIADNRIAELATWDADMLASELKALSNLELGFSIELTGFDTAEIDFLVDSGQVDRADDLSPLRSNEANVTQAGDLWLLRIIA